MIVECIQWHGWLQNLSAVDPSPLVILLTAMLWGALLRGLGYAEIHYRWRGVPSRLYRDHPEIVLDMPFRADPGQPVPLFLFVKDAHQYPVELVTVRIQIISPTTGQTTHAEYPLNKTIAEKFFTHTMQISPYHFRSGGEYRVVAELHYRCQGEVWRIYQDNYAAISHEPFTIYISDHPVPSLPNLYWGDLHVHSNFTDDAIEFGASLRETILCAMSLGLQFLAITDHSYDLDDAEDDYLRNDDRLPKWRRFLQECALLNDEFSNFVLLPGEEVSAGNRRGHNVHCLVVGNRTFYPGQGDGGENGLLNRPTLSLKKLFEKIHAAGEPVVIAAAHPLDKPPLSHRLLLNRGYWREMDLIHPHLHYWQILNGRINPAFYEGLEAWKVALLRGRRVGILAGTDAHGNFNCTRQIQIPFYRMEKHREQLLGQARTGVLVEGDFTPQNLLRALQQKRTLISTGPAATMEIHQRPQQATLGGEILKHTGFTVRIAAASTPEFGSLQSVILYVGDYLMKWEQARILPLEHNAYGLETELTFPEGLPPGYLRLGVYSGLGHPRRFCLTNPIWIR